MTEKRDCIRFDNEKWPGNFLHVLDPSIALPLSNEQMLRLEEVIEGLTDRQKEVLSCRAKEQLTLEKTSKKLGITRERIRQVQNIVIRKFSHRSVINWVIYGENETLTEESGIDSLGLSVRTYNCLKRKQLRTIGDVVDFFKDHTYVDIRNMGEKSYFELREKILEKVEIKLPEPDPDVIKEQSRIKSAKSAYATVRLWESYKYFGLI